MTPPAVPTGHKAALQLSFSQAPNAQMSALVPTSAYAILLLINISPAKSAVSYEVCNKLLLALSYQKNKTSFSW